MADQPISGIYAIVNLRNGKRYIGSAVNLSARWRDHKHRLQRNKHHSVVLQRAWHAYGAEAFAFWVMQICPVDHLIALEQTSIEREKPEYNICLKAGSSRGRVHSPEARAKMAAARLGSKHSAETKAKMSLTRLGRKLPERRPITAEHREKLRMGQLRRWASVRAG